MASGTKPTVRRFRRLPRPGLLLLMLLAALLLFAGLAIYLSQRRTRELKRDVESLNGSVTVSRPAWSQDPHVGRFAPLFERVSGVSISDEVDDRFLIRAASVADLEYVSVRGTGITDAGALSLCSDNSLLVVSLRDTSVTDRALLELSRLSNLTSLRIDSRQATFSDAVFAALAQSPRLTRLWLGPASLTEQGAANLEQLQSLEHLQVDGGRIDTAAFPHLGRMTELRTLCLDVEMDPDLNPLPQLRRLIQLEELALPTPAIDDLAARDLCRFGHLERLSLSGTSIGDETVRRLAETESPRGRLEVLQLDGTRVTDACLEDLTRFPRLRLLSVRHTEFSEAAAAEFCRRRRRLTVQYSDSSGQNMEMTWNRLRRETGGTMRWPDSREHLDEAPADRESE